MQILEAKFPSILNFLIIASVGFFKIDAVINPIINGIVYFKVPITIEKEIVNTKKKIIKFKKGLIFLATKDIYSTFTSSTFYIKIKRS